jgi:transcription initiation factor TFIIIB Brf1 subunit/transcription initiation factor TFIIB
MEQINQIKLLDQSNINILNEKDINIKECMLINERLSEMNNKNMSIQEKFNILKINNDEDIEKISKFMNNESNLKNQIYKIEDKMSMLNKELNLANNKLFD